MKKTSGRNRILILSVIVSFLFIFTSVIGMLQLRSTYTNQIVSLLGVVSDGSEISKEKIDIFLSGDTSGQNYDQGLLILHNSGYGQSGISLIYTSVERTFLGCFLGMAVILSLILGRMVLDLHGWRKFLKATARWVSNLNEIEYEQNVIKIAPAETRELIYALQEHKQQDLQEKETLEQERKKTIAFVEDISHQLKTPLTIMRMHMEKMNFAKEFIQISLDKAITQVDKMVLQISMMLKVGMLNCGKRKMEIGAHDIRELAEEISEEFEAFYERKQVELHSLLRGNFTFYYDDYWLKEAVENLVKNCIEYSERGEVVTIVYQIGRFGLNIAVTDHGRGIEEENIEHIFERFTSSYRQNDSSSGLGLAIAKQVTEAHFGKISVKNNREGGVTFSIYLPRLHGEGAYLDTEEGGALGESFTVE